VPEARPVEVPPLVDKGFVAPYPTPPGADHSIVPPTHGQPEAAPAPHSEAGLASPEQALFTADHTLINALEAHIYVIKDASGHDHLAAFGGTDESRFALMQRLLQDPQAQTYMQYWKSIMWAHNVPSITGPHLRVDELGVDRIVNGHTTWNFGFFKQQPLAPTPENYTFVSRVW
jgi:hypothetical protein